MYAQCTAAAFRQYREISASLSSFYYSKGIFLFRHGEIGCIVASDLQKNAAVWTAFVSLPGGMQKPRTEAWTRRHFFRVADGRANSLQRFFVFRVHRNVAEHSEVIAGADARKMRLQYFADRLSARKRSGVFIVRKQFGIFRNEKWRFRWKTSGRLVLVCELFGFDFARFHVRLVERVDTYDRPSHSGGDLPATKLLAECVHAWKTDTNDWMTGCLDRRKHVIMRLVRDVCQPHIPDLPATSL